MYLRFTTTASEDIRRGTSLFKTSSMEKAEILPGICAFSFDDYELSDSEIEAKIRQYAKNYSYYSNCGMAALIDGEYLGQNKNGEGVIIRPLRLIREITL